ncbi:hypothetical protein TWF106_007131 [Orbilia oligospora]|uniref:Serine protease n=1 Tax=Orbilia oligospora TaxID=2813651 RepID=A0A7C8UME3_ORBOL|nr:hypothetical protein TWF106_007131 [Orbilia oligospora]
MVETLSPLFYDPGWSRQPEPGPTGGLELIQVDRRNEWVVKLKFTQAGKSSTGTGFYLNVPGAESHVIVTAGHNLINEKGDPSKNIEILQPDGKPSIQVKAEDVFISESFEESPTAKNAENDYGVILTKRDVDEAGASPDKGFGFSLKFRHEELMEKVTLEVCGYQADSEPGQPKTSSGPCTRSWEDLIEYDIMTQQGLSGSPVCLPYKGHEAVIAIHHGQKKKSTGTCLNEKVLRDVFCFAKVGYKGKSLKVVHKQANEMGIYLRISGHSEFGRVRLGKDGLDTAFDIFPGYSPVSGGPEEPLYVFHFIQPPKWPEERREEKWVLWDASDDTVSLTEHLQEFCFVKLVRRENEGKDAPFWVVLPVKNDLVELRMQVTEITPGDIKLGVRESSEIWFDRHFENKVLKFNYFQFE